MERNNLLLQRSRFERSERNHDGKVIMMRLSFRWCSNCLEFACWNGGVIYVAIPFDAYDRKVIAWRAVAMPG